MPLLKQNSAPSIVSTWKLPLPRLQKHKLGRRPPKVITALKAGRISQVQKRALAQAEVLFCLLTDVVDSKILDQAPRLRIIANLAAGTNHIDLLECARRGITVLHTPDVLTEATAELTLALLLAVSRRLGEGERLCRANRFPGWSPEYLLGFELRGRQAVIVGQGRIGRAVARKLKALGVSTDFITREDSPAEVRRKLKRAQILSFHCPLTPQTHRWLDAKRIALLPRDAIVLNTARGPVIDEQALANALRTHRIFGAALDVYTTEPRIPAFLRKLPNAFLCPHLGSATRETRDAMLELLLNGLARTLQGKRATNQVKLPRLQTSPVR